MGDCIPIFLLITCLGQDRRNSQQEIENLNCNNCFCIVLLIWINAILSCPLWLAGLRPALCPWMMISRDVNTSLVIPRNMCHPAGHHITDPHVNTVQLITSSCQQAFNKHCCSTHLNLHSWGNIFSSLQLTRTFSTGVRFCHFTHLH